MASSSNPESYAEEEVPEEELEYFDDFTVASAWERFISDIETVCRQWISDGTKNLLEKGAIELEYSNCLYKVKTEMNYAKKCYTIEYYFETKTNGKVADWSSTLHELQLCFGVDAFLIISPQSASGVVLDAPEASKLLSAVAIALSNCSCLWPAFVPVHDPYRKAYIGIQNMGTVFTRRFEADSMGSQVPIKLMHLEGLFELFISKFAYSTMDFAVHPFKVHFRMKLTYRTLACDDDVVDNLKSMDPDTESGENLSGSTSNKTQWDDGCPWSEWYSAEDPIKGFDLIAIWSEKIVESSLEMAEFENLSPNEAERWLISPNILDGSKGSRIGFFSQLRFLVDALEMSFGARFMEDFVSVENSGIDILKPSMVLPPPTVIDRMLKELFQEEIHLKEFAEGEHKNSRFIKGAPLESLFAQFCLHSMWFGSCNMRAVAVLWIEFVREIRWCWEESQPLPRMSANGSIGLATCLINQKLQMLAICIEKKRQLNEDYQDCIESDDFANSLNEEEGLEGNDLPALQTPKPELSGKWDSCPPTTDELPGIQTPIIKPEDSMVSADTSSSERSRRGSAGAISSMMLLNSCQSMHAPFTQNPPLMTEDMHEERLQAVEAFSDSFVLPACIEVTKNFARAAKCAKGQNFSGQLEKDILSSDMSAFKAANPDAVFEDFIRWHSPGDWESYDIEQSSVSPMKVNWPPKGQLSKRMSEHGNLWRMIWNSSPALPAYEQKPLLDPNREAEKILHYLETLRPHQLLEQMVCTAFRAAADNLSQTSYGKFKPMATKMDQLYLTMESSLKPLQANRLSAGSDIIEDLRRLCVVFEHVEKLMILAASLHRKFLHSPRLSEEIFSDYCSSYQPKMGLGSSQYILKKELVQKQVRNNERAVISSMFTSPSANQSWRKVLSMGNLLNGHEPILREIIFSSKDSVTNNHYAVSAPQVSQLEIEMYRMYISGTSNDLRVALSVVSCD